MSRRQHINPGEDSTLEEALAAQLEGLELLSFIRRRNRKPGARYFRLKEFSPEAVVGLPFLAVELFKSRGKRKYCRDELDRLFAYAHRTLPRRGLTTKLAELFDCSQKHARETANRLGLRKK